jgi:hypothetical protein
VTFAEGVWDAMAEDKDVKIIYLHRENRLKCWLSKLVASRETWVRYRKTRAHSRFRISPKELLNVCRWYDEFYDTAKSLLSDHESLEVVYEELTERPQEVLQGVQEFLGLDPMGVCPHTFKSERRSLRKVITNYGEVEKALRDAGLEHFLDDEPESEIKAHEKPRPAK